MNLKKIFAGLMSVLMLLTASVTPIGDNIKDVLSELSIAANAATTGDYEYEILNNGTVEITYYYGTASTLTIPSKLNGRTVSSIGEGAFAYSDIKILTVPDSVINIGSAAFFGCEDLTKVTLGKGVKNIDEGAFYYCTSLSSINIPTSVKTIGDCAFLNCYKLTSITIPASVTTIGDAALGCLYDFDYDSENIYKFDTFRINCYSGTAGEKYATTYGFDYRLLNIPANVTGLKMTSCTETTISMSWNKVSGATGYVVYQAINGKWQRINVTSGNTLTVSNLKAGTNYRFTVKAYRTFNGKNYYSKSYTGVWMKTSCNTPANVTGLKMTSCTASTITMSWSKVNEATGYVVYQAINGKWQRIQVTKGNTLTVSNLKAGTNYRFTVKAYKTVNGKNYYSKSYTGVWMTTLPDKPAAKMTINTAQAIRLEWDKVTGATEYVVYKQVNGIWQRVTVTKGNVYVFTGLESGTNYNYAVRACKTLNGKSYYSAFSTSTDTVKACTKPAAVSFDLTADTNEAIVSWNEVTGATGYIVYYKTSENGKWTRLAVTTDTSYIATELVAGETYYFTVKAYKTYNGKTYDSSFTAKSIEIPVSIPTLTSVYLLDSENNMIHIEGCAVAETPENYDKTSDLDAALAQGYEKCGECFH